MVVSWLLLLLLLKMMMRLARNSLPRANRPIRNNADEDRMAADHGLAFLEAPMCACILDGSTGRVIDVNSLFAEEMGAKFKFLEFAFEKAAADAENEAKLANALRQAREGPRKCRVRDVKMLTLASELPIARHFDWTVSAMSSGSIAVFGELVMEADEVQREKDAELIDFFQNAPIAMHWLSGEGIVL